MSHVSGALRQSRARTGAIAAVAAVVVGGVVVLGVSNGNPAQQVQLLSGSAWLASDKVGQLTLLDGSTAEVAAQVQVAPAGNVLKVVQQGSSAYAVDQSAGTVRRVDGATFDLSQPRSPIPDAHVGLTAFAGPGTLYTVDTQRGVLAATDPQTLERRGEPVPLAAKLAAGTAALDDDGRLWTVDNSTGDLTSYTAGHRSTQPRVAKPGINVMTLVNGMPVIVDTTARTAMTIDPYSGKADRTFNLELRLGDSVQVSGSPHGDRLYIVVSRGVLNICDLKDGNCDQVVPLDSGSEYGAPVEAANRLFVPDYKSGQVWIVDLTSGKVLAKPQVLAPGGQFQLLTRDGVVFFNSPNDERAGVIQLDGNVSRSVKYDAKDPAKGLGTPNNPDQPKPADHKVADPAANEPAERDEPKPPKNEDEPQVDITVSNANPKAGENVTLQVTGTDGTAPKRAEWTFGDGSAEGVTTTHTWARTQETPFLVTVKATMPNDKTANKTLNVRVHPKDMVTLSVSTNEGGRVTGPGLDCPGACTNDFETGARVTLTPSALANHEFTGWSAPCAQSGKNPCELTLGESNMAVSATFTSTKVKLTASVPTGGGAISLGGNSCTTICPYFFPRGDSVLLSATPNEGFVLTGWSNGCGGTALSCQVTANTAKTIAANFAPKPKVNLIVTAAKHAEVSGGLHCLGPRTCQQTFDKGTVVTLTAKAIQHGGPINTPVFNGWTGACESYGKQKTCTLTLTGNPTETQATIMVLG